MWHALRENLLLPIFGRAGTAASVWLLGQGMPPEYSGQLETALLVIFMLAADWTYAYVRRQTIIQNTATEIQKGVRSVTGAKVRPPETP